MPLRDEKMLGIHTLRNDLQIEKFGGQETTCSLKGSLPKSVKFSTKKERRISDLVSSYVFIKFSHGFSVQVLVAMDIKCVEWSVRVLQELWFPKHCVTKRVNLIIEEFVPELCVQQDFG